VAAWSQTLDRKLEVTARCACQHAAHPGAIRKGKAKKKSLRQVAITCWFVPGQRSRHGACHLRFTCNGGAFAGK